MNLIVAELAVRTFFALRTGPRVLLYGTPWHHLTAPAPPAPADDPFNRSVQAHRNDVGGYTSYTPGTSSYSKYFPHEEKWTESPDRATQYPVRINNYGFRGRDFTIEKPPGTIRILTLGASSTFGYHDRDDETYPVYLEQDLQRAVGDAPRFEVINFAIPHATTDNILGMFQAEGLALSPDVVTFYEGTNDAAIIESREGQREQDWRERLVATSMLAAVVDRFLPRSAATDVAWWWSDELAQRRSHAFLGNLDRLTALCRARGIHLIVATQQFRSTLIPSERSHGLTYDEEVALLREMVARGDIGPGKTQVGDKVLEFRIKGADPMPVRLLAGLDPPRAMLIHVVLMNDLRAWAPHAGVGFVDVIHELDGNRDLLINWVHLRPEANAIIARALARSILTELDLPRANALDVERVGHAPSPTP